MLVNYCQLRDEHVPEAARRYARTKYGFFGVRFGESTIARVHGLVIEGLARMSMREPQQFSQALRAASRKGNAMGAGWTGLLDPVIDWVLERLGVSGWRRFAIRVLIQIIILLVLTAAVLSPGPNSSLAPTTASRIQTWAHEANELTVGMSDDAEDA